MHEIECGLQHQLCLTVCGIPTNLKDKFDTETHIDNFKSALMHRQYMDTHTDRRRSGRPRETTLRQDRHITLIHLRTRFVTAVDTARRTPGIRNN